MSPRAESEQGHVETRRGRRYGHATCVLCIDIDRLKAINDGLGQVARIGGDEFAVILPETSAAQASALSQRILTEVARHSDALTGKLGVSIGIAELNATSDVESDDMLAAADVALYRAKAAGGGRAAVAGPAPVASRSRDLTLMDAAPLIENQARAGAQR